MDLDRRTLSLLAIGVIIIIAACFIFLAPSGTTTDGQQQLESSDFMESMAREPPAGSNPPPLPK